MSSEIQVQLNDDGTLTLTPLRAVFVSNEPVTWSPTTANTRVEAVAVVVSGEKLPRFKEISTNPATGELRATAVGVARKSMWGYHLQVNGTWYTEVRSGETSTSSEDTPELQNETPGLGDD